MGLEVEKLREISYKEHDTWQQGWCLLVTGGMMDGAVVVVERHDGTIIDIPIRNVQFNDRVCPK